VADIAEIARLVTDCTRYWKETGVPKKAIDEMHVELTEHLTQAVSEGRDARTVVGPNVADFAEAWASEYRQRPAGASWEDTTSGRTEKRRTDRKATWAYGIGILSLTIGAIVGSGLAGGGSEVENIEFWGWFWTIAAIGLGVGEIFTAGFFMFPFAVGAAAAAVLAWIGINVTTQWLVFFGVSLIALAYLRRFVTSNTDQPKVGAFRLDGARGTVISEITAGTAKGMVRVESEEWRAETVDGGSLPVGTPIRVEEVRGSRLIVTPIED